MNSEQLHKTLSRLRTELAKASGLDEDSRSLLQEIMNEAQKLPPKASNRAPSNSRLQRLEALAVQFEANYPTLGAALRELVELLAQAGV